MPVLLGRVRLSRQLESPSDSSTDETAGIKVETRYPRRATARTFTYVCIVKELVETPKEQEVEAEAETLIEGDSQYRVAADSIRQREER